MISDPFTGLRRVFLRDLVLLASIGVHPREQTMTQRVRINLDLGVVDTGEAARRAGDEDLRGVVDYEALAMQVRAVVGAGHVRLIETLAERLARLCLDTDPRVMIVRMRLEKLDVFTDAAAAGVEIVRRR